MSEFDNVLKAFGMSNMLIETNLRSIQEELQLDLGKKSKNRSNPVDIRLEFGVEIRNDSEIMSKYYAIFYCMERQAREIVQDVLSERHGVDWWNSAISDEIKREVAKRIQAELESGMALRSTEPVDYTTFGELGSIIEANWSDFDDIFNNNRKATKKLFSQLNQIRGPIAHNSKFVQNEGQRFNLAIADWLRLVSSNQ